MICHALSARAHVMSNIMFVSHRIYMANVFIWLVLVCRYADYLVPVKIIS